MSRIVRPRRLSPSPQATLRIWLWSPDAPAMDMRHYDTRAHGLDAVYEDVQPGLSTPLGVARTSELTLWPSGNVPTKESAAHEARAGTQLAVIGCTPDYLHQVRAFGLWSLPDRSTPFKRAVEDVVQGAVNGGGQAGVRLLQHRRDRNEAASCAGAAALTPPRHRNTTPQVGKRGLAKPGI